MYKRILETILIFGIVFFGGFLQGTARAETDQTAPKELSETDGSRLSGIDVTTGGFLSYLRDDSYVKDSDGNIKKDVQGHFAKSLGTLAHVPLVTLPEFKNQFFGHGGRLGVGLSGGFGLNGSDIVKNLQIVGGGSIFFKTENAFIAFTFGKMVGPVQRLKRNYAEGSTFPDGNVGLTKPVYEVDNFFALTVSANLEKLSRYFNVGDLLKGNTTDSKKDQSQAESNQPPQKSTDKKDN